MIDPELVFEDGAEPFEPEEPEPEEMFWETEEEDRKCCSDNDGDWDYCYEVDDDE